MANIIREYNDIDEERGKKLESQLQLRMEQLERMGGDLGALYWM
jgi:hypothetical protein